MEVSEVIKGVNIGTGADDEVLRTSQVSRDMCIPELAELREEEEAC